ncbi:hypothetical protein G3480_21375 [Thiorhodococcus mannitoliphagus]|uniref:Uncharacterized protein n=1 Tax=Thiorhodococcus mannitoliphagus TaxID=329406 RepID=A0A6P1DZB9_9GAMM|nr:hypothetical protein [Thiorhodococcus mannitoliphagus]NEX22820.1 hypothetical protein [Thiorhodococcus mannitoliphagus]
MGFFIQRYAQSFRHYWWLLLLALLPPAVYLISQIYLDRMFIVSQEVSYSGQVQVAKNPMESLPLERVLKEPHLLFQEDFALSQLSKNVRLFQLLESSNLSDVELRRLIDSTLSLSETTQATILFAYRGKNEGLGILLVDYFVTRLTQRAEAALVRSRDPAAASVSLATVGPQSVAVQRTIWDDSRLGPATMILLVSLILCLIAIGLMEVLDQSFKSDRQIARYIGLPILGGIPNAEPLTRRIKGSSKG